MTCKSVLIGTKFYQEACKYFATIFNINIFQPFFDGPITSKQVVVISVTQKVTVAKSNSLTRAQFWLYLLKTQRRVWWAPFLIATVYSACRDLIDHKNK